MWELVEGIDHPKELESTEFLKGPRRTAMSFMKNIMKISWVTGNTVTVDGGFCMLRGFIGMF